MTFRPATIDDCPLLAELNHQLIRDEGHRNRMTVAELEERMRGWLRSEYRAVLYEDGREVIAYALFREQPEEDLPSTAFCPSSPSQSGHWPSCRRDSAL